MSKLSSNKRKLFVIAIFAVAFSNLLLLGISADASAIVRNYKFTGATDWWTIEEKTNNDRNYYIVDYCQGTRHQKESNCGGQKVKRANWVRTKGYGGHLECWTGEWEYDAGNTKGYNEKAGTVRRNTSGTGLSQSQAEAICVNAKYPNGIIFKSAAKTFRGECDKEGGCPISSSGGGASNYMSKNWRFPTKFAYNFRMIDASGNLIGGAANKRYDGYGYCANGYDHASEAEAKVNKVEARITSISEKNCTINVQAKFDMDDESDAQDIAGSPAITVPYICPASFSGTTRVNNVTSTHGNTSKTISGTKGKYKITDGGEYTTKVKFDNNCNRTDENTGEAHCKIDSITENISGDISTKAYNPVLTYRLSGKNSNDTTQYTTSIKNENIKIGTTKTVCEHMHYSSEIWHTRSPFSGFVKNNDTVGSYTAKLGNKSPSYANSANACVTLERPYNFSIGGITAVIDKTPVYPGEDAKSTFEFSTKKMHNEWGIPSTVPEGLKVTAVHFIVKSDVDFNTAKQKNFGQQAKQSISDPNKLEDALESFVRNRLGSANITDFGKLKSQNFSQSSGSFNPTAVVPDLTTVNGRKVSTVGYKYCVAAISSMAEFDQLDTNIEEAYKEGHVSNIACRPIAKRPYMQVENSSLYSSNGISTTNSLKRVNSTLGDQNTSKTAFGSWSEYFLIAKSGKIAEMSSGGALSQGYPAKETSANKLLCSLSSLTIANKSCNKSVAGSFKLGESGIEKSNFAEAIISYFQNDSQQDLVNKNTNTVNIGNVDGFGGKTAIITSGDVNITGNIVADNGSFVSNSTVSQHIIISTGGNINIHQNVDNVDAWLIAPKGSINTCTKDDHQNYSDAGSFNTDTCNKKLTINGIIASKNFNPKRTAGMETTEGNTAAERVVFNPTAYLWSYQQATRKAGQANVVYTRELAPRE
ncbi:hypothetical protein IKF33_01010 [Candidatus Saccharibacteria bacterium]|nr:hypothetical protein [Candidatus Saccharibacteria bacterium]